MNHEYSSINSDENLTSPITFNPRFYKGGVNKDSLLGSMPISPGKQTRKETYPDDIILDVQEESDYPSSKSDRKKTDSGKYVKQKENLQSHNKELVIEL